MKYKEIGRCIPGMIKSFVISILLVVLIVVGGLYIISKAEPISIRPNRPIPVHNVSDNTRHAQKKTAGAVQGKEIVVQLNPQDGSGEIGLAIFTDIGRGKTKVRLSLSNAPDGVWQPASIQSGSCSTSGRMVYDLANPKNGVSESIIYAPIDRIQNSGPLAIEIQKSVAQPKVTSVCGEIPKYTASNNLSADMISPPSF